MNVYADIKSGKRPLDRRTARVLFMTFEHEGLHAEVNNFHSFSPWGNQTHMSRRCYICWFNVPDPEHFRPHHSLDRPSIYSERHGTKNTKNFINPHLGKLSWSQRELSFSGMTISIRTTQQSNSILNTLSDGTTRIPVESFMSLRSAFPGVQ